MAEGWFGEQPYFDYDHRHVASTPQLTPQLIPQQQHSNEEASRAAVPRDSWDDLTALYPEHLLQQHYTESPLSFNYQHLPHEDPAGPQSQWAASPGNYQNWQTHEYPDLDRRYPEQHESTDWGVEDDEREEEEEETTVAHSVYGDASEQTQSQAPEQAQKQSRKRTGRTGRRPTRKEIELFHQQIAEHELRGCVMPQSVCDKFASDRNINITRIPMGPRYAAAVRVLCSLVGKRKYDEVLSSFASAPTDRIRTIMSDFRKEHNELLKPAGIDGKILSRTMNQGIIETEGKLQANRRRMGRPSRASEADDDVTETNDEPQADTTTASRTQTNERHNAAPAPARPLGVHRPDELTVSVEDSDATDADVVVKYEEDSDSKAEPETDDLKGLDVQQEYVRCLTMNRPGDHDDSLTTWSQALISNADTPTVEFHLLVEDTRWQFTPARTDENVHFLSLHFGRKLLSGALAAASPTDILEEFTRAMPDELRDRFTRFVLRAKRYQPDLSSTNNVLDVSTSWPAGDVGVLTHFKQRLVDELAKIPGIEIPDNRLISPKGRFDSPFACFMTYPCQGKNGAVRDPAQFGDQAFPSIAWTTLLTRDFPDQFCTDLIPYVQKMQDVGCTSTALPGRIKTKFGDNALEAFNAYSKEVFERAKAPFILTQGELWDMWLHKEADNIEFISLGPFSAFKRDENGHHFALRVDPDTNEITAFVSMWQHLHSARWGS